MTVGIDWMRVALVVGGTSVLLVVGRCVKNIGTLCATIRHGIESGSLPPGWKMVSYDKDGNVLRSIGF